MRDLSSVTCRPLGTRLRRTIFHLDAMSSERLIRWTHLRRKGYGHFLATCGGAAAIFFFVTFVPAFSTLFYVVGRDFVPSRVLIPPAAFVSLLFGFATASFVWYAQECDYRFTVDPEWIGANRWTAKSIAGLTKLRSGRRALIYEFRALWNPMWHSQPLVVKAPLIWVRLYIADSEFAPLFGRQIHWWPPGNPTAEMPGDAVGVWGRRRVARFKRLLRGRGAKFDVVHDEGPRQSRKISKSS